MAETKQCTYCLRFGHRASHCPATRFASCGDTVEVDIREPYPQTRRLTLLTPEATAFANELLARPNTPCRLVERQEPPNT
jgi:hypothetical protein